MKRFVPPLFALFIAILPALAQSVVPDIPFTASQPLGMPKDTYFGEVAGVATNSKGDIFVFQRSGQPTVSLGGSRTFAHDGGQLLQFDAGGKFVHEIARTMYGILVPQQIRIDAQDNIWLVDAYSRMIIELDPSGGHVVMLLGRKPESVDVPEPVLSKSDGPKDNGAGLPQDIFNSPTDVAWDKSGNIFVADGRGADARIAKFDHDGVFVKSWGMRGAGPGQFHIPHSIQIDEADNVYVADRGNRRIEIFDTDGNFKREITGVGDPAALCLSTGAHPYLYSSSSNPPDDIDNGGEITKLELGGTVVGSFGRAGKLFQEFGTVNEIDCRKPGTLFVAEIGNYRVQKLILR